MTTSARDQQISQRSTGNPKSQRSQTTAVVSSKAVSPKAVSTEEVSPKLAAVTPSPAPSESSISDPDTPPIDYRAIILKGIALLLYITVFLLAVVPPAILKINHTGSIWLCGWTDVYHGCYSFMILPAVLAGFLTFIVSMELAAHFMGYYNLNKYLGLADLVISIIAVLGWIGVAVIIPIHIFPTIPYWPDTGFEMVPPPITWRAAFGFSIVLAITHSLDAAYVTYFYLIRTYLNREICVEPNTDAP